MATQVRLMCMCAVMVCGVNSKNSPPVMVLSMIILAERLDRRRYGCDWCSDDDDNGYSGSAYVYVRSNGVWSEQAKANCSDGAAG